MADTIDTAGNQIAIKKPKFLTMVGIPANQTAFKVVRSANHGEKGEKQVAAPIIRRTRRSDVKSPIMRLDIPTNYSDEEVETVMDSFGLHGFTVTRSDQSITALRSDLKSTTIPGETQEIKLTADGIVATVAKSDTTVAQNPKSELAIAQVVLREGTFDSASAKSWLSENGFGDAQLTVATGDDGGAFVVTRSEVPEGEETRTVALAEGVEATIIRADVSNIPAVFVASVNETAYGNWGWGHLDFAATMADKDFSEHMRSAVSGLEEVLRQILFYSPLPLADRKALVGNALTQFGAYADNLLDSLPRQIMVAVARSAQHQLENVTMPQAQSGAATTNTGSTNQSTEDTITVKRSELQAMIVDGVTAALKARSDADAAAKAQADADAAAKAASDAAAAETIQRAAAAAIEEAVKPLKERLEQLTGTTIVRSGDTDPKTIAADDKSKTKTEDVFRGAFAGLRGPAHVTSTTTKV